MDYNSTMEYAKQNKDDNIRYRFVQDQTENDFYNQPKAAIDSIQILDHGFVSLLQHMGTDIDIVNAARVSFDRESDSMTKSDIKLLKYLLDNRHSSPFEMVELKFMVKCPIFVARQWIRHRTGSYNEVSRRYTSDNIEFYSPRPEWIRAQSESNRQASVPWSGQDRITAIAISNLINDSNYDSLCAYNEALEFGASREQARGVLGTNLYTKFIYKTDLSNLLHFLRLRLSGHAQWEVRQYAEAILSMIEPIVPETVKLFKRSKIDE